MGKKQEFHKGDLVRVAKDLGPTMSHFQSDCDAIVIASYKDQYGGNDTESYTIHIKGYGQTSWYDEHQLTLIKREQLHKLKEWEKEEEEECELKSNLDWIFSHGPEVLENSHGASIGALAQCFGLESLWGSSGEGMEYFANAELTMQAAKPYLEANDKEGWLEEAENIRVQTT